jgi:hypothetical protein
LQTYECVIKFDKIDGSYHGQFKAAEDQILHYSYRVIYQDGRIVDEKEPKRSCILMNPSEY